MTYKTFEKLRGDFPKDALSIGRNKYFVDRDGEIFEYVLKYLQNKIISFPSDFKDGRMLLQEADFYGLHDLKEHLQNGAGEPEVITLLVMDPKEQLKREQASGHLWSSFEVKGIDILLSWMRGNSEDANIQWKDLFQGFINTLHFKVYTCKGIERFDDFNQVQYNEYYIQYELENANSSISRPYFLNVREEKAVSKLVNGLLSVGFTIISDEILNDVIRFKKNYKRVRELTLKRIRPCRGLETAA